MIYFYTILLSIIFCSAAFAQTNYAPGQVIVKFKDSVEEGVESILEGGKTFKSAISAQAPETKLDEIKAKYGFKKATPLFRSPEASQGVRAKHGYLKTSALKESTVKEIETIRRKYPKRSKRVPRNAPIPNVHNVYVIEVKEDTDIEALAAELKRDPHVEYAQPSYFYEVQTTSASVPAVGDGLWGMKKIDVESAWAITQGEGTVVAVIDTGVDYNHSDIRNNIWTNPQEIPNNNRDDDRNGFVDDIHGWNFVSNSKEVMDIHGHGTHVAGTIAAEGKNQFGIVGVAPKTKIMALSTINDNNQGSEAAFISSLYYAVRNGADVINNSWIRCGNNCNPNRSDEAINDAITYAYSTGAVIIFAAGNYDRQVSNYTPTSQWQVIRVAATDQFDRRAIFSNYGNIDVSAPGVDILSLSARNGNNVMAKRTHAPEYGPNYLFATGTSMAAPHVSGLAALILARQPNLTVEEVRKILQSSTDDVEDPGFDEMTGYGRINARKAMQINSVIDLRIAQPTRGQFISVDSPTLNIRATAQGNALVYSNLSFSRNSRNREWSSLFNPFYGQYHNALLATLDVSNLPIDNYLLRLTGYTRDNYSFEEYVPFSVEDFRQITRDNSNKYYPQIHGQNAVWTNDQGQLYLYNSSTGRTIYLTAGITNHNYAITEDKLVWQNGNALIVNRLGTRATQEHVIDAAIVSKITASGNKVAWVGTSHEGPGVYVYDTALRRLDKVLDLNEKEYSAYAVKMWGDYVLIYNNDAFAKTIILYQISTSQLTQITDDEILVPHAPSIWGEKVIWFERERGIVLYDILAHTKRVVVPIEGNVFYTAHSISGDNIVYVEQYSQKMYVFNLRTSTNSLITGAHRAFQDNPPQISQSHVMFARHSYNYQQIFIHDLNVPPEITPIDDAQVEVGHPVIVNITANDENRDQITLRARLANGDSLDSIGATFLDLGSGHAAIQWEPSSVQAGQQYAIQITALDSRGLSSERVMTLSVQDNPQNALRISDFTLGPSHIRVGEHALLTLAVENISSMQVAPQGLQLDVQGPTQSQSFSYGIPSIAPHGRWSVEGLDFFVPNEPGWHKVKATVGTASQELMYYVTGVNNATFRGMVFANNGAPLASGYVALSNGGVARVQNGNFEIRNLAPGYYTVRVLNHPEYLPVQIFVSHPDTTANWTWRPSQRISVVVGTPVVPANPVSSIQMAPQAAAIPIANRTQ